mmetsp:Transcript_30090/g.62901  ORF Transcript_30090/g.62901 Transcript_30090/m.62901 type:complete len:240 (-) Transcript_30090:199-918(-)
MIRWSSSRRTVRGRIGLGTRPLVRATLPQRLVQQIANPRHRRRIRTAIAHDAVGEIGIARHFALVPRPRLGGRDGNRDIADGGGVVVVSRGIIAGGGGVGTIADGGGIVAIGRGDVPTRREERQDRLVRHRNRQRGRRRRRLVGGGTRRGSLRRPGRPRRSGGTRRLDRLGAGGGRGRRIGGGEGVEEVLDPGEGSAGSGGIDGGGGGGEGRADGPRGGVPRAHVALAAGSLWLRLRRR